MTAIDVPIRNLPGPVHDVPGIDPATGLASDYLNHFYEPLLLLEQIGDNPDFIEELAAWAPNSYVGHFGTSRRADRLDVLTSYMDTPPGLRRRLDDAAREACRTISAGISNLLLTARLQGDTGRVAAALAMELRGHIHILDSIIHARNAEIPLGQ